MTTEFASLRADLTADAALAAIRQVAREAETIYYVYVTDDSERLLGVLSLRDLVLAAPTSPIEQVTVHDPLKVHVNDDQETAARLLAERGLLAIPVVDADEKLVGIITADDVADILEEEASEDIARLGGSEALDVPYLRSSVLSLVKGRVGWLLMLFVAGAFTSTVLQFFEDMLSQVVVLAFFIPLLIGTGGNVGSQTVTTLVRAIALGEVHLWDVARILRKELAVATFLGLAMATAAYLRAWTMRVEPLVAIVVSLSAYLIVLWAAIVGAILPLVLRRVGADPAVASAPFISTLVDTTGLFLYFAIARFLLNV
jgi:magnesium transporter